MGVCRICRRRGNLFEFSGSVELVQHLKDIHMPEKPPRPEFVEEIPKICLWDGSLPFLQHDHFPDRIGIYGILAKENDRVLYVGSAASIRGRWGSNHHKALPICRQMRNLDDIYLAWKLTTDLSLEYDYIARLEPPYNSRCMGDSVLHKLADLSHKLAPMSRKHKCLGCGVTRLDSCLTSKCPYCGCEFCMLQEIATSMLWDLGLAEARPSDAVRTTMLGVSQFRKRYERILATSEHLTRAEHIGHLKYLCLLESNGREKL